MSAVPAVADLDIETPFGSFSADSAAIVTFKAGLPGFETCRRFVLVSAPSLEPFTCLHGLDGHRPSFLAIDPHRVVADYAPALSGADRRRIDAAAGASLLWLSLVRLADDGATANLRAPVVVNPARMLGVQVLEIDAALATDHPLTGE